MRAVTCAVSFVLVAGCFAADPEPATNLSAIELSSRPADELLAQPAAVEAALRSCPINCIGVCACIFLRCVQDGGDVAECTASRDECLLDCYE